MLKFNRTDHNENAVKTIRHTTAKLVQKKFNVSSYDFE